MKETADPPKTFSRLLLSIGPGLIVAGSIVGSGELIATTKTGAEAGFSLLWLIVLGCVIKVFAQIEFGRYAIISGKTTLRALDEVPGPRFRGRGNWLVWYWLVMWLASISQLGGIVGGVGQALSITAPLSTQGSQYNEIADAEQLRRFQSFSGNAEGVEAESTVVADTDDDAWSTYDQTYERTDDDARAIPPDTAIWAIIISIATSVILVLGRYNLIQSFSTALVASFTLLVVINVIWLQNVEDFSFSASEVLSGFRLSLPTGQDGGRPVATALATFGIIGVGAAELVTYPYWCLEKGYGSHVGKNDGSAEWKKRASGWMRVMHFDAWGSMVIYTFATIAFYLMGASVLHRIGLNPEKSEMVRTLAVMFRPVFSDWAAGVFLFGAIAVLYSTFFVANASHARMFSDVLRVIGMIGSDEQTRERWVTRLSGLFPILCVVIYLAFPSPAKLVLISGITQGIMLPMLGGAALYFRYAKSTEGMEPGPIWDIFLWISAFAMLVTGTWTVLECI